MNIKNLLVGACVASVALFGMATVHVSGETLNDPEFNSALSWAYENGLTKYNTVDSFMPFANLTREQFAKFAASFAVTNVCLEADTSAACGFSDVPADPTLGDYVTLACQMGLVKGSNGKYMPTANVSKAEVLTVMSRALAAAAGEDAPSEDVTPRWSFHYSAMYSAGITKEIDVNALDRPVTRYEVLLMLYRAKDDESGCSDVDITGLLQDLFGDDVTDTTEVTESNGMVKAMLSPSTPNGVNLPGLVTAKVASFDLTATDEDVVLQEVSLKRMGLGSDSVVSKVTVFANGDVVTKSRSFNSDDEAILSLNPAVTIKKGQTVTIDVVAKVGNSTTVSNEQFAIALFDFATNGQETTSNLPVQANTFGVAGVNGAVVTVTPDGTVSDVNLGDSQVEVAKFQLDNGSDNDVTITSVTLKDDESKADDDLANFTLKHDGETVATSAKTSGKYVTFTLATPVAISQNKSEDFRVYADVTAGAGDQVAFTISQEVYIAGVDAKYGYGIAVSGTDTYTAQTFDILAGDLTLVEHSLDNDQIRENSDNVVLAEFGLNVNAGQDLSLENIKFTANSVSGSVFDNEQLEVTIDGSVRTYDLTESTAGANPTYSDTDLGIYLKAGSDITVRLIADTTNSFEAGWIGDSFAVSMLTSTAGGFKVIENDDDTTVTDIVPSSITFDTIDLVESTVTVARLSLGDVDVVRGAANVDAVKFQVQTDDVSSVFVNSFTLSGDIITSCTGSSGLFNSSLITALRVWMWNGSTGELVEAKGGTKISSELITFDNFSDIEIPASTTQQFLLTVDVADDDNLAGCDFNVNLASAGIDDDDNNTLTVNGAPTAVGRAITVNAGGTLSITRELTDPLANRAKHVLGGTTSDYLAAFELNAVNEGMDIEDLVLQVSGAGASNFADSVSEVILYDADGAELDREFVSTTPVTFDNVNLNIDEGSTMVYVKVVADLIGKSQNGETIADVAFRLAAANVKGAGSSDDIVATYDDTGATLSGYAFDVIPVHMSDIALVSSYSSYTVPATANNGTEQNLAIVKVTANTWDNTDLDDNSALKLVLSGLAIYNTNTNVVSGSSLTLKRIDISNGTEMVGIVSSNTVTFNLAASGATIDKEITKGSTAYYLVRGTINAAANATIRMDIKTLNDGTVVYESSDSSQGTADDISALRLGVTEVNGPSISVTF